MQLAGNSNSLILFVHFILNSDVSTTLDLDGEKKSGIYAALILKALQAFLKHFLALCCCLS